MTAKKTTDAKEGDADLDRIKAAIYDEMIGIRAAQQRVAQLEAELRGRSLRQFAPYANKDKTDVGK